MNKLFLLLFPFLISLAKAQVECRFNGERWQPYQVSSGLFLGDKSFGYSFEKNCLLAINGGSKKYACQWHKGSYLPFDKSTAELLGDEGARYSNFNDCQKGVNLEKSDFLCLKKGKNWFPYSLLNRSYLGNEESGFSYHSDCWQGISEFRMDAACTKDDKSFKFFSIKGPSSLSFPKIHMCREFLDQLESSPLPSVITDHRQLLRPFKELQTEVGYTYTHCHPYNDLSAHWVQTDKSGKLLPSCLPDTLYSWGDFGKVKYYHENYGAQANWSRPLARDLFLAASPLATFGYGPIPLRVKLKKDVRVILRLQHQKKAFCSDLSHEEKLNAIIVNLWTNKRGSGLDYILCSFAPVSSWSYGTSEHYDEILRELSWVQTHDPQDYELYYKKDGVDKLWNTNLDDKDFRYSTFLSYLSAIQELIHLKVGGVFAPGSNRPEEHFTTDRPIYFNPN